MNKSQHMAHICSWLINLSNLKLQTLGSVCVCVHRSLHGFYSCPLYVRTARARVPTRDKMRKNSTKYFQSEDCRTHTSATGFIQRVYSENVQALFHRTILYILLEFFWFRFCFMFFYCFLFFFFFCYSSF